jgi:hypothetical protein
LVGVYIPSLVHSKILLFCIHHHSASANAAERRAVREKKYYDESGLDAATPTNPLYPHSEGEGATALYEVVGDNIKLLRRQPAWVPWWYRHDLAMHRR